MNTTVYKYGFLIAFERFVSNIFSVLYFLGGLIGFAWSLVLLKPNNQASIPSLFVEFIGWSICSPLFWLFLANIQSDVTINSDELSTRFLWFKCDAKWDSIVDVKVQTRLFKRQTILIVTKGGLTPFHRVFENLYGKVNSPALIIFPIRILIC